jgi:thioredoxin
MNKESLLQSTYDSKKLVIVEFWAPWCVPCRMMTPALEAAANQFNNSVTLTRVNADEYPELVKEFSVFGIPSIIVLSKGKEIARHTGAMDRSQLEVLFSAAVNGVDIIIPPAGVQRILRIGSGLAVALIGYLWGPAFFLYLLGAVLVFSGLYDRCPIFRAIYPKIRSSLSI